MNYFERMARKLARRTLRLSRAERGEAYVEIEERERNRALESGDGIVEADRKARRLRRMVQSYVVLYDVKPPSMYEDEPDP